MEKSMMHPRPKRFQTIQVRGGWHVFDNLTCTLDADPWPGRGTAELMATFLNGECKA